MGGYMDGLTNAKPPPIGEDFVGMETWQLVS